MNQGACLIPDRPWFKIDEVCKVTGVREYIIKFWEKENLFAGAGLGQGRACQGQGNDHYHQYFDFFHLVNYLLHEFKFHGAQGL